MLAAAPLDDTVLDAITRAADLRGYTPLQLNATQRWVIGFQDGKVPTASEVHSKLGGANLLGPTGAIPNTIVVEFPVGYNSSTAVSQMKVLTGQTFFYPLFKGVASKRDVIEDPLFPIQWHLQNTGQTGGAPGADANVIPVWNQGIFGDGVTIGVVDDGLQHIHADLNPNYLPLLSFDVNDNDLDPDPAPGDGHGTSVAGVIAGRDNNFGVRGSAPHAGIAGLRLLGAAFDDFDVSRILAYGKLQTDIYNNSWGPPDNAILNAGDTSYSIFGGPLQIFQIKDGTVVGRKGLGDVYLWAAGNGGDAALEASNNLIKADNINYDSLANNRFVIAVGGIGHDDKRAPYSERGAPLFIVAPTSDGPPNDPATISIVTTDLLGADGYTPADYTNIGPFGGPFGFGGTSSATPLVAGVVALIMQANPTLTYRDIMQILAETARQNDPTDLNWRMNGGGFHISDIYGFGAIDALASVTAAQTWTHVLPEMTVKPNPVTLKVAVPNNNIGITDRITLSQDMHIERVEVVFDATTGSRGNLRVELTSPQGTTSVLAEPHPDGGANYVNWTFSSVQQWGESTRGTWTIRVSDPVGGGNPIFNRYQLRFYGVDNYAPRATNDVFDVQEDTPTDLSVLGNDQELDGTFNLASVTIVAATTHGTAVVNTLTGKILYTPNANYFGPDSLTYTVKDNKGAISRIATVQINVISVNDVPVARNDVVSTLPLQSITINVLANDTDVDTDNQIDPATVVVVNSPSFGTVNVLPSGKIVYAPQASFNSSDTFTYTVNDTAGGTSNVATVTVNRTNLPPVALDDNPHVNKNTTSRIKILNNDSDPDGTLDKRSIVITTKPRKGTATVDKTTGEILYTPNLNFFGSDSLMYTVNDNQGSTSNVALVNITVDNSGPPAALDREFVLAVGAVRVVGVLTDSFSSGLPLTAILVTPPMHGSVQLGNDGSFSYTVGSTFKGLDRFTYKLNDGVQDSNVATVTLISAEYRYVRKLYTDLLRRDGAESEILYWVDVYKRAGRVPVVNSLLNSDEYRTLVLDATYRQLLGRNIDAVGLANLLSQMRGGVTIEQVTATIAAGAEFYTRNGSNDPGFVRGLYRDLLGRTTSPTFSEVDFWVNKLAQGASRLTVATAFIEGREYRSNVINSFYVSYLKRPVDLGGLNYWLGIMQTTKSRINVQLGVLSSEEYFKA